MARMGLAVCCYRRPSLPYRADLGGHCTYPIFANRRMVHHMHSTCIRACYNTTRRHGSLAADNKQHVDQGDRRQIDIKRFERGIRSTCIAGRDHRLSEAACPIFCQHLTGLTTSLLSLVRLQRPKGSIS